MQYLFGFLLAASVWCGNAYGQSEQHELEIPDSVVIHGRASYELLTQGAKQEAYYGHALPVERTEEAFGLESATTLPPHGSKQVYPTPIRHGGIHTSDAYGRIQHYGNASVGGRHLRDWQGYLSSGEAEFGGGYGHTDNAGWHSQRLVGRTRRIISWNSSYNADISLENGQTGVWGMTDPSRRNYHDLGVGGGGDLKLFGDNQFKLYADVHQRGVSSTTNDVSEQFLRSRVGWERASGRFWLKGQADYGLQHTERDSGVNGNTKYFSLGAEAWTRLEENFGGAVGVTIYSVESPNGDTLRKSRPSVAAWARFGSVKFTARLSSGLDRFGIIEAYRSNSALDVATPLRMPFQGVNLHVKADMPVGRWNELSGGMHFLLIDDIPVWRRSTQGEPFIFLDENDERANIISVYGRYFFMWTRGSADALVIWRDQRLEESGKPVPFLPDWEAHLGIDYTTLYRGAKVSPSLQFIGPRSYLSVQAGEEGLPVSMDPYYLVGLEVTFPTQWRWDVSISANNLLNSRYDRWDGVRGAGIHVQLGAQRTW
jgi:hypothetical protein